MPITAYSNTYKRELDVAQLESIFNLNPDSKSMSFHDFVKSDIECPACNVRGGHTVKEGISSKTGKVVSQAHFAFKNYQGMDTHLRFCEFYSGKDKQNLIANEGTVNFRKSNSAITRKIGVMVSIGLENNIFSQSNMRDMRQWFFDLRKNGQDTIDVSPHIVNLARSSYVRSKRNSKKFILDIAAVSEPDFDIDEEVYESLAHKYSNYKITDFYEENSCYEDISKKHVVKKAINIIKRDSQILTFDRSALSDQFTLARRLAIKIMRNDEFLTQKLSRSAAIRSNPLMALSTLLLFISDWNIEEAWEKVKMIYEVGIVKDENAGNFIGLNPFVNYSVWVILKKLTSIKNELKDALDYDFIFNEEKIRLMGLYGLDSRE